MTSDFASDTFRPGPHRVALLATAFTLPLLFVGGSVTSFGAGMAMIRLTVCARSSGPGGAFQMK